MEGTIAREMLLTLFQGIMDTNWKEEEDTRPAIVSEIWFRQLVVLSMNDLIRFGYGSF
jgi:hypothetical protein